jgi:hypothetical protein
MYHLLYKSVMVYFVFVVFMILSANRDYFLKQR